MGKTIDKYRELPAVKPFIDIARPAVRFSRATYRNATCTLRILPDFIIIGAQKGGTTSLYSYLITHPSIGRAATKELSYFDHKYQKGLLWYRAQFPTTLHKYYIEHIRKLDFITGEASPDYFPHPHAPRRVAELLPHVKLIAILRNPVDRLYSQYRFNLEKGFETLSFEDALAREEERTKEERERVAADENYFNHTYQHYSYLARGIYADQLEQWFKFFPREQFLLLKTEDFFTDPVAVVKETLAFLNVPTTTLEKFDKEYRRENKSKIPATRMKPELRKELMKFYEPHNARLYELVGRDFGWK